MTRLHQSYEIQDVKIKYNWELMTASQFQLKKLILHRTISCEGAEPSQEMEQMLVINGTNLQMQC